MTLDEAIEQNKQWIKEHPHLGAVNDYIALPPYKAIQLGIEAMERLKKCRQAGYKFYCQLMPGETEEGKQ